MKRVQLIEIGIIAVVLILGFRAVETILNVFIYTLYSFVQSFGNLWDYIWPSIIQLIFYCFGFFILLKNRTWIANYILGKNQENDDVGIRIEKPQLLYVVIISLCIASLLADITNILIYAFDYFKTEVGGSERWTPKASGAVTLATFKASLVKLILTFVLLYFARPVSNALSKPSADLPVAETKNNE